MEGKKEPPPIRSEEKHAEDYAAQWRAWWNTLTPDRQAEYEEAGLTAPEPPRRKRRRRQDEIDEEEASLATCAHLAAPEAHEPDEALMAKEDNPQKRRDLVLLAETLPHIADAKDARLEASILALALKVGARQGITVGGLAHQHLVEHDDIHRAVRSWAVKLDVCRADVELLRYVIAPILKSQTPGLEAESIAKAARVGLGRAQRMEDIGLKHGVCRASVSFRTRNWCKKLSERTGIEFPLPRECKRNTDAYRLRNVRKQTINPFE